jgi:hypothetical protein
MENVVKELKIVENHEGFNAIIEIKYYLQVVFICGLSSYIAITPTKAKQLMEKGLKKIIEI